MKWLMKINMLILLNADEMRTTLSSMTVRFIAVVDFTDYFRVINVCFKYIRWTWISR